MCSSTARSYVRGTNTGVNDNRGWVHAKVHIANAMSPRQQSRSEIPRDRENNQGPVWKVRGWQRSAASVLAPRQPCRSGPLAQTHALSVPIIGKGIVAKPTLAGDSRLKHRRRNNLLRRFLALDCPSVRKAWGRIASLGL
jgi:hypothetical protein